MRPLPTLIPVCIPHTQLYPHQMPHCPERTLWNSAHMCYSFCFLFLVLLVS